MYNIHRPPIAVFGTAAPDFVVAKCREIANTPSGNTVDTIGHIVYKLSVAQFTHNIRFLTAKRLSGNQDSEYESHFSERFCSAAPSFEGAGGFVRKRHRYSTGYPTVSGFAKSRTVDNLRPYPAINIEKLTTCARDIRISDGADIRPGFSACIHMPKPATRGN